MIQWMSDDQGLVSKKCGSKTFRARSDAPFSKTAPAKFSATVFKNCQNCPKLAGAVFENGASDRALSY